jgi:FlgN protein
MKDYVTPLFNLSRQCIQLSEELQECFKRERKFLIQFKSNELLENNATKERLILELVDKRQQFRNHLTNFQDRDPEPWLGEPELSHWKNIQIEWDLSWRRLVDHTLSNQEFLKHSLRNLDMLHENISRLFGLHTVYTAKGVRVERKAHGNVVQGRF